MLDLILSTVGQGLQWSVLALGVFLTFRILDIADLSVEGSFPLGAAVAATAITAGLGLPAAFVLALVAGSLAGGVTGLLTTKLRIPALLAGILTMIGLYSVNLHVMGKSNVGLLQNETVFMPSRKAHCESIRCNEKASGSALGSPFGRAGFAKQRLRGRGRQDVQMPLPVAAPPVKNAFGALRRVLKTQNYKEPFRGIWSERSGDHFKSSRSQGTDCKAFTDLQPLNSYWTFAQSYGIILSAIAGIVHRLVYQPSKLRRWVRFPLPAPKRPEP